MNASSAVSSACSSVSVVVRLKLGAAHLTLFPAKGRVGRLRLGLFSGFQDVAAAAAPDSLPRTEVTNFHLSCVRCHVGQSLRLGSKGIFVAAFSYLVERIWSECFLSCINFFFGQTKCMSKSRTSYVSDTLVIVYKGQLIRDIV